MPSDVIRNQLIKMATALQQAADIIDPKAREVRSVVPNIAEIFQTFFILSVCLQ